MKMKTHKARARVTRGGWEVNGPATVEWSDLRHNNDDRLRLAHITVPTTCLWCETRQTQYTEQWLYPGDTAHLDTMCHTERKGQPCKYGRAISRNIAVPMPRRW